MGFPDDLVKAEIRPGPGAGIMIWRSNTVRFKGFLDSIYRIARIPCIQVDLPRTDSIKESLPSSIHISDGALSVYKLCACGNLDKADLIDC